MTIYQNKVLNPEKPWSFMDDTKENILKDLAEYTLNPVFEKYGNFVYSPTWDDEKTAEKYKGLTAICGNFLTLSHAFRLLTDDVELIEELTKAIRKNQETEEYKKAKARLIENDVKEKRSRIAESKGIGLCTFPDDDEYYCKYFEVPKDWLIDVLQGLDNANEQKGVNLGEFLGNYIWEETLFIYELAKAKGKLIFEQEG